MIPVTCRLLRAGILAAVASVTLTVAALSPARAACYTPAQQLPAQTISAFKVDPAQLLGQFRDGGAIMIGQIRDLVASDPTTLPLIIALLGNPNITADQVNAIGFGLGQSALVCLRVDQAFATEIQHLVAATNNDPMIVAFSSVLGDRPIAALGGGAGGASGGGGGGQINPITGLGTFSGGPSFFANTSTPNTATNLFTSSSLTPGSPATNTTTVTNVTIVSPSR
jgi:hypothetical protein